MALIQRESARLERGWEIGAENQVPGLHQGSVDRYDATQSQKEDGRDSEKSTTTTSSPDPNKPREKSIEDRLCEGDHPVEAGLRPERTIKLFKDAIDRNYVHIKVTKTRGGAELGVSLDRDLCDFSKADFENGSGTVHLEGGLVLDYVKARCIADINIKTLEGTGHLEKVEAAPQSDHV